MVAALLAALLLAGFAEQVRAEGTGALTAAERGELVEKVCKEIERLYPFEELGGKTRDGIRERLRSGAYDEVTSPDAFAARVTADMEDLSGDKHLDLYHDPVLAAEILAREGTDDAQAGASPSQVESARWENFGFKAVRLLDGQVGYLDLRMFFAARHAGPTAVAAMEFLSASNALIIDLRRNGGGWDDMVTLLAGYFLDPQESEVVAVLQSTLDESYFASVVPSYVPGKRMADIPLYLLTSSGTASAAEAFASILKHARPDVVTVGQTTAGAESPVEFVALNDVFVLKIPCYRKVYFGTRPGWEGAGLAPDIEVPIDRALETAHLHALRALSERFTDETAREKLDWAVDAYRAVLEPQAVARDVLESYAGRYRGARVFLDGADLFLQFDDRPKRRLVAISPDYFLVEDRDDLRLRFVREGGSVTGMERIYSDGYRALHPRE